VNSTGCSPVLSLLVIVVHTFIRQLVSDSFSIISMDTVLLSVLFYTRLACSCRLTVCVLYTLRVSFAKLL
jgi:hypothetical protein